MALADDTSPVFTARGMNTLGAMFKDFEKVRDAYKGDGAMSWGDHDHCLFKGTESVFRTGYRAHLPSAWIPALDGVEAKLQAGARVADIGCGHGASAVVMAEAYPTHSSGGSTSTSRRSAPPVSAPMRPPSGTASRSTWPEPRTTRAPTTSSASLTACTTWAIPSASPRTHASISTRTVRCCSSSRSRLDGRRENVQANPMAALLYIASSTVCTPNSLSQEVGLGLGAQAGEARLRAVFEEAGFSQFRRGDGNAAEPDPRS